MTKLSITISGTVYENIKDYFRSTVDWKICWPTYSECDIYRSFYKYRAAKIDGRSNEQLLQAYVDEGFPHVVGGYLKRDCGDALYRAMLSIEDYEDRLTFVYLLKYKYTDIYELDYATVLSEVEAFIAQGADRLKEYRFKKRDDVLLGTLLTGEALQRYNELRVSRGSVFYEEIRTFGVYITNNNIDLSPLSEKELVDYLYAYYDKKKYKQAKDTGFMQFRETLSSDDAEKLTAYTRLHRLPIRQLSYEDGAFIFCMLKNTVASVDYRIVDGELCCMYMKHIFNKEEYSKLLAYYKKSKSESWVEFYHSVYNQVRNLARRNAATINTTDILSVADKVSRGVLVTRAYDTKKPNKKEDM